MEIYGKLFRNFKRSRFFTVAKLLTTVCATGGGAYKFEEEFHKVSAKVGRRFFMVLTFYAFSSQEVNMQLQKFDELDALIKGILYAETHNRTECYYYENASDIK
jgi:type II pantothenate kinase